MDSSQSHPRNSPENSNSHQSETEKDIPSLPVASLELLVHYTTTKTKRLRAENPNERTSKKPAKTPSPPVLPAASIVKLAQAQLLQLNAQKADVFSFAASSFGSQSGLPSGVSEDFELALRLLAAVEKVARQQFVYARKLLSMCHRGMSKTGNVIQKVSYYFAECLQERIDREWGIFSSEELERRVRKDPVDVEQNLIRLQPEMMKCQQEIPFCLFTQFTAIQTILDCVASAKKVHLIDFGINNGSHWTLIMQALSARSECPLEHLKITAVGTSREMMEETGKWLTSFAQTISLPFSFDLVVSEMKDLKEQFLESEADEMVAVFLGLRLWTLLPWPNHLENFIRVIKSLRPSTIVINEMEASINSPEFIERVNGAFVLITAIFDCIDSCMHHRVMFRKLNEEVIFPGMIQNIVTAEGRDWIQRYEKISFWREVFGRVGIEETEMSRPPPSQEKLFLSSSDRLNSCTVDLDGKCLILGWQGSPLMSVSAWKIKHHDETSTES